jgi:NAD(P)-dependent dehydrogenase (short-subunit alcohol dehydrogenase family)
MNRPAIVLVAGGTGALGSAVTQAFVDAGASVIVSYRQRRSFDDLLAQLRPGAVAVQGIELDAGDEAAVRQAVAACLQRHGRIDALVNAIGGYAGGAPLWEQDGAVLEQMIGMNLRAMHALLRAVVPAMRTQGAGAIVNVAAMSGLAAAAGSGLYAASKAAVLSLMATLADELRGSGVRANSVLPGTIDTPANRSAMPQADLSTWTAPQDIARVIGFLCSDEARAIHGAAIPVRGGH